MKRDTRLYVATVTGRIVVWALVSALSHKSEAWDSDLYFTFGIPTICALYALLAILSRTTPGAGGLRLSPGKRF